MESFKKVTINIFAIFKTSTWSILFNLFDTLMSYFKEDEILIAEIKRSKGAVSVRKKKFD